MGWETVATGPRGKPERQREAEAHEENGLRAASVQQSEELVRDKIAPK